MCPIMEAAVAVYHRSVATKESAGRPLPGFPAFACRCQPTWAALSRYPPLVLCPSMLYFPLQNLKSVSAQRLSSLLFLWPRAWDVRAVLFVILWVLRRGARRCGRLLVNRPVLDPPGAERQGGAAWHGCGWRWRNMELQMKLEAWTKEKQKPGI